MIHTNADSGDGWFRIVCVSMLIWMRGIALLPIVAVRAVSVAAGENKIKN